MKLNKEERVTKTSEVSIIVKNIDDPDNDPGFPVILKNIKYEKGIYSQNYQVTDKPRVDNKNPPVQCTNNSNFDETAKYYKCGICKEAKVESSLELTAHIRDSHGLQKSTTCHICANPALKFDHRGLTQHFELNHPAQLPYACKICKATFPRSCELIIHKRIEQTKEKVFPCQECSMLFYAKSRLKLHQTAHSAAGIEKPHKCDRCYWSFTTEQELNTHKLTHPSKKHQSVYDFENCRQNFSTMEILNFHESHKNSNEQEARVERDRDRYPERELYHDEERPFVCAICNVSFTFCNHLTQHLEKIHREFLTFKFVCYICKCKCFTQKKLNKHVRTQHPQEKPFGCEICGKGFNTSRSLAHHKLIHMGKKNFMCDECPKFFFTKSGLVQHMIIHKKTEHGETFKPYVCMHKDCKARFNLKGGLTTHAKIHSEVKSHKCEKCGKSFRLPHQMRAHLKTHKKEN